MSDLTAFSNFAARLRGLVCCSSIGGSSFEDLALELFALQHEVNEPFRRLCVARGVSPKKARCWTEIPAVATRLWKEFEFSCLPVSDRPRTFFSSGTTQEQRSRHFHNRESLAIYEESLWPWFSEHLLEGQGERRFA